MSGNQHQHQHQRHVDAFDHIRTQVLIWAIIESLKGSQQPVHELLRDGYRQWQEGGDLVRPPDDLTGPAAALDECYEVLDIAVAMYDNGHLIDAPEGCRAVEAGRAGTPDITWIGFCDACRSSHIVPGWSLPEEEYQGTVPVPVLTRPPLRLRPRRRTSATSSLGGEA